VRVLLVSIVLIALIYSLQALGFVLVIRGTGVLNFAQGQMLALGAYLLWDVSGRFSTGDYLPHFLAGVVASLVIMGLFGALLFRVILVRLEGAPIWAVVMLLFGVGAMLDSFLQVQWGSEPKFLQPPFPFGRVVLPGGFVTNPSDLAIAIFSTVAIAVLLGVIYLTPLGLRMRATAENPVLAAYAGVNVRGIATVAWLLSAVYVALAGIAIALRTTVSPEIELAFLTAFPAVVLGGFESIAGAVVGSVILAAALQVAITYFGSPVALPLAYLVLLLTLVVRPQGLFGARDIIRI
jgi:branched-chain amino acid transport system permease protein